MRAIFALELCLPLDAELQAKLRGLVLRDAEQLPFGEKWSRYAQAVDGLLAAASSWHRGCWDFWDDERKAYGDFQMWVDGMLTREGVRPGPSGAPDPYRGEPRYMTFTMAAVIVKDSSCCRGLAETCDIPEPLLWRRATFQRILQGVKFLSFASVEKDTMYLIPGDLGWGLTAADLEHPKFEYLRRIVD